MPEDTTTIQISTETWADLDRRKGRGESFDDVIQKLLEASPVTFGDGPLPDVEYVDHEPATDGEQCVHHDAVTGEQCDRDAEYVVENEVFGDTTEFALCEEHVGDLPEPAENNPST